MRRVWRVLLFVAIGAVVNVLVAWGCARWGNRLQSTRNLVDVTPKEMPRRVAEWLEFHGDTRDAHPGYALFPEESLIGRRLWYNRSIVSLGTEYIDLEYSIVQHGWPCVALQNELAGESFFPVQVPGVRGGWPLEPRIELLGSLGKMNLMRERIYPLVPVPIGFSTNTAFYGVIAWGVVATLARVRRWRRARRGWCVACGYDVAGLARCPECGRARS